MRRIRPGALLLGLLAALDGAGLIAYNLRQEMAARATPKPSPPVRYTLQPVGSTEEDKAYHGGGAINDLGQVVGATISGSGLRAFLWEDGRITDLGILGAPLAINNRGQVAGRGEGPEGTRAFLWQSGRVTYLTSVAGFPETAAMGINERGQVVGRIFRRVPGVPYWRWPSRAVVWQGNRVRVLGQLRSWIGSQAAAINERGDIVGRAVDGSNHTHAALWENRRPIDLGIIARSRISSAAAIRDDGEILGTAGDGPGSMRAMLWRRDAGGGITAERVPRLPYHTDTLGAAFGANGAIFAHAKVGAEYAPATVVLPGSTAPLEINSLLPAGSGWYVSQVFGANRRNDALVYGFFGDGPERLAVIKRDGHDASTTP